MSNFVRIATSAGSPEGTNSAYLLPERGVLIDPGPPTERAWKRLRRGIGATETALSEIDHVLVTHWHVDHVGLAPRVADRADATVHMHATDEPLLGNYAEERERRLRRDARRLEEWGVPRPTRESVIAGDTHSPLPDEYAIRAHDDGDVVAGLEIVHVPGHTAGHAAFSPADHAAVSTPETVFVGDLLLPTYTPNVGGGDTRMTDPLGAYAESINRIRELATVGEPGHGTTIELEAEIESVTDHHVKRAAGVIDVLSGIERATPWDVATALFGEMHGVHAKFGAGEAAAHLRRLAERGAVERVDDDPVLYHRSSNSDFDAGDLFP